MLRTNIKQPSLLLCCKDINSCSSLLAFFSSFHAFDYIEQAKCCTAPTAVALPQHRVKQAAFAACICYQSTER